jgi:hypothetical protein
VKRFSILIHEDQRRSSLLGSVETTEFDSECNSKLGEPDQIKRHYQVDAISIDTSGTSDLLLHMVKAELRVFDSVTRRMNSLVGVLECRF